MIKHKAALDWQRLRVAMYVVTKGFYSSNYFFFSPLSQFVANIYTRDKGAVGVGHSLVQWVWLQGPTSLPAAGADQQRSLSRRASPVVTPSPRLLLGALRSVRLLPASGVLLRGR